MGTAEQSVPNEMTSVADEKGEFVPLLLRKLAKALMNVAGAWLPRICAAVYRFVSHLLW